MDQCQTEVEILYKVIEELRKSGDITAAIMAQEDLDAITHE